MSVTPTPNGTPPRNQVASGKLSSALVTNISIISVVGVISILLMLFGDFDGKVSRVVSTLLLFAAFSFFSTYDISKTTRIQMQLSQIGNIYMLVLGLILIWGSLAFNDDYYDEVFIIPFTCFIIILVKLGVLLTQRLCGLLDSPHWQVSLTSRLAVTGTGCLTVLFTLPLGFYDMVDFGEWYWKFAVAVVLFTGLTFSIMGILVWSLQKQAAPQQQQTRETEPRSEVPGGTTHGDAEYKTFRSSESPASQEVTPAPQASPNQAVGVPPQFAPPVPSALPWPVFPNGQPLPVRSNGRPDFSALQQVAKFYADSESQFFG